MQLWANWFICGIVVEARELTSEKNKSWRGYVAKVQTLGDTFELQLDEKQYRQLSAGQHLAFTGSYDNQNGRQRFVVESFVDASKAKQPQAVA